MPRLWKQFIQMTRTRCACETNERWLTAAAVNGVSDEDAICAKYGVTKIETVAEEYVACVGQLPMMTMISHAENQGKREREREGRCNVSSIFSPHLLGKFLHDSKASPRQSKKWITKCF